MERLYCGLLLYGVRDGHKQGETTASAFNLCCFGRELAFVKAEVIKFGPLSHPDVRMVLSFCPEWSESVYYSDAGNAYAPLFKTVSNDPLRREIMEEVWRCWEQQKQIEHDAGRKGTDNDPTLRETDLRYSD